MIKLRLFTLPKCPKCPDAKKLVERLQKRREDIEVEILDMSNEENFLMALQLQIITTPSFVINETPIFIGELPTFEELNKKVDEYKKKFC